MQLQYLPPACRGARLRQCYRITLTLALGPWPCLTELLFLHYLLELWVSNRAQPHRQDDVG